MGLRLRVVQVPRARGVVGLPRVLGLLHSLPWRIQGLWYWRLFQRCRPRCGALAPVRRVGGRGWHSGGGMANVVTSFLHPPTHARHGGRGRGRSVSLRRAFSSASARRGKHRC